ncbi:unnamed protein product [marine sediment metagenome]|uniref:Uncharacterized protein n=1 Tax=marine sediment metagenome TaxID=412755 RepID=X0WZT4_9ZZZZ
MIGIIDPAMLLRRTNEKELVDDLGFVLGACRKHQIQLPAIEPYWERLWDQLGRPLEMDSTTSISA